MSNVHIRNSNNSVLMYVIGEQMMSHKQQSSKGWSRFNWFSIWPCSALSSPLCQHTTPTQMNERAAFLHTELRPVSCMKSYHFDNMCTACEWCSSCHRFFTSNEKIYLVTTLNSEGVHTRPVYMINSLHILSGAMFILLCPTRLYSTDLQVRETCRESPGRRRRWMKSKHRFKCSFKSFLKKNSTQVKYKHIYLRVQ